METRRDWRAVLVCRNRPCCSTAAAFQVIGWRASKAMGQCLVRRFLRVGEVKRTIALVHEYVLIDLAKVRNKICLAMKIHSIIVRALLQGVDTYGRARARSVSLWRSGREA